MAIVDVLEIKVNKFTSIHELLQAIKNATRDSKWVFN